MPILFYTVYKTTCVVNNKIYIGAHKTTDPNDSYLGSGSALKAAVKKYGRSSFRKEVLFAFHTQGEMLRKEQELVTMDFCLQDSNYNLKVGGRYGTHTPAARKKIAEASRVAQNRPEMLDENRQRGRKRFSENPEGFNSFLEAGRKASRSPKGRERARQTLAESTQGRTEGLLRSWASYTAEEREARIQKTAEVCRTDEYRAKMSRVVKGRLADPEVKEKLREGVKSSWTPERRKKHSEEMKKRHAQPGYKARIGALIAAAQETPEARRKMALRRRRGESVEEWKARTGVP